MEKYIIFRHLPLNIQQNIKLFYVPNNFYAYCVTNDNKVYRFEEKNNGGNNYEIINELCDQCIEEFFEGKDYMFARNTKNQIFSWGWNIKGLLLRNLQNQNNIYVKPQRITIFDNKNIINISCGLSHCIALSSDGVVYGWGNNKLGQIGCGTGEHFISIPIIIDLKAKTCLIYCSKNNSFAVTIDGNLYYWGTAIRVPDKCEYIPKLIEIKSVLKVCLHYSKFYILDSNGHLFNYNSLNDTFNEIKFQVKFIDLYEDIDYLLLRSEDCIYQLECNETIIKTNFINFFDFCSQKSLKYKKTIFIKDGYLMTKEMKLNRNNILIPENKYLINKYENIFEEIREIGWGTSGVVMKVKQKSKNEFYAIKRVEIRGQIDLNEIDFMSRLSSDFVVKYIDSWIEDHVIFKKITKFLFIQMELCSQNMREIIDTMNNVKIKKFEIFEYFLSCELFKELTECVDYLHSYQPHPIIHRDLKPENVLISNGVNGRFLKLCDFKLSTTHIRSEHTRVVGTISYMAPEVFFSKSYNTKSDIYSLALISTEIFQFEDNVELTKDESDFEKYLAKYLNTYLEDNYRKLLETLSKCLHSDNYHFRPDCKELLKSYKEFSIDKDKILKDQNIKQFQSSLEKENFILKQFFDSKILQNANN